MDILAWFQMKCVLEGDREKGGQRRREMETDISMVNIEESRKNRCCARFSSTYTRYGNSCVTFLLTPSPGFFYYSTHLPFSQW